jgi:hypothetical protein
MKHMLLGSTRNSVERRCIDLMGHTYPAVPADSSYPRELPSSFAGAERKRGVVFTSRKRGHVGGEPQCGQNVGAISIVFKHVAFDWCSVRLP